MKLKEFDYFLPKSSIAQYPKTRRDQSCLMVLNCKSQSIEHYRFKQLPQILKKDDVLVMNNSKVIPARLIGTKKTGAKTEITLSRPIGDGQWYVFTKSRASFALGDEIVLPGNLIGKITGARIPETFEIPVTFNKKGKSFMTTIGKIGRAPLPPYITRSYDDGNERCRLDLLDYQPVYAKDPGSVAAPTAGLHFTKPLLSRLKSKGIGVHYVTLHVGPGTFKPVTSENIKDHKLIPESYRIASHEVNRIRWAKRHKRRVIAVGSTTLRVLEAASKNIELYREKDIVGETDLFIYPGYKFCMADALITNFHLPCSTLFMLVAAFGGLSFIQKAYQEAIKNSYRFYSYGDAMLIFP